MRCNPKALISRSERPFIFSTFLEGDRHSLNEKERVERLVDKIKGHSTHDGNALGVQRIKGAFFFSRRLFEWDLIITLYIYISLE